MKIFYFLIKFLIFLKACLWEAEGITSRKLVKKRFVNTLSCNLFYILLYQHMPKTKITNEPYTWDTGEGRKKYWISGYWYVPIVSIVTCEVVSSVTNP